MEKNGAISLKQDLKSQVDNNGSFRRLSPFFSPVVQPKLTVNEPGDAYEQEANAVADKVMRMKAASPLAFFGPAPVIQPMCAHCEEEQHKMQRKEMTEGETDTGSQLESYTSSLGNGGSSLSKDNRGFFESRMGYEFSNVKIHDDVAAAKSANSINALAYTSGNHIVFNEGQYSPETDNGKRLLAHELTHVIQQDNNIRRQPDSNLEQTEATSESEIEIYHSSAEGEADGVAGIDGEGSGEQLDDSTSSCPVTAVFSSTLAGTEKQTCQVPQGKNGVSKLTRYRLQGVAAGTAAAVKEQFTSLEDTHKLFSKLVPNSFTTNTGIFDDCYMIASASPLPSDLRLKVKQNHLLNNQVISENEITYTADNVGYCTHKRIRGGCDFGKRCGLA